MIKLIINTETNGTEVFNCDNMQHVEKVVCNIFTDFVVGEQTVEYISVFLAETGAGSIEIENYPVVPADIDWDDVVHLRDVEYAENHVTADAKDVFDELSKEYPDNVDEIREAVECYYDIDLSQSQTTSVQPSPINVQTMQSIKNAKARAQCTNCRASTALLKEFQQLNAVVLQPNGKPDLQILQRMGSLVTGLSEHWESPLYESVIHKARIRVSTLIDIMIK